MDTQHATVVACGTVTLESFFVRAKAARLVTRRITTVNGDLGMVR
jgi:hypothetical protein